jgi:hypothetical protein
MQGRISFDEYFVGRNSAVISNCRGRNKSFELVIAFFYLIENKVRRFNPAIPYFRSSFL